MHLFLEHDARWLAARANAPPPACDALIVRRGATDDLFGCRTLANILDNDAAEPWMFDPDLPRGPAGMRLVSWSGSLAPDLASADPRNWLATGREALDAVCDRIRPALERHDARVCFVPHCRHVLSDAKSALHFSAARTGQPFEIALDPAALVELSMLPHLGEHLDRMFAAIGPIAAAVFLADLAPPADDDVLPRRVPLGDGVLPRDVVLALVAEHVPHATPIVIEARDVERQLAWLHP